MRTVTFSDPEVAAALSRDFVSVWRNRNDSFHDCSPTSEKDIFKNMAEAFPTKNICTFFLTADLQVLHYVSGYYSPSLFLDQVSFARRAHEALYGEDGLPRWDALDAYQMLHAGRAESMRSLAKVIRGKTLEDLKGEDESHSGIIELGIQTSGIEYDGVEHVHSRVCMLLLQKTVTHLMRVHEDLAGRAEGVPKSHSGVIVSKTLLLRENKDHVRWPPAKTLEPRKRRFIRGVPRLNKLQHRYLFGNKFTEERVSNSGAPTVKKESKESVESEQ